jgi:hypothetical protein
MVMIIAASFGTGIGMMMGMPAFIMGMIAMVVGLRLA